jgi:hypothetical protein
MPEKVKYKITEEKLVYEVLDRGDKIIRHELYPFEKREQKLIEHLRSLEGPIYGFLNFVDKSTLLYLKEIKDDADLFIIVGRIKGDSKSEEQNIETFKKLANDFKTKRCGKFEAILFQSEIFDKCPKAWMHDRILLGKNFYVSIGGDLKKDSILAPISYSIQLSPSSQWKNYEEFVDYFKVLFFGTDDELKKRGVVFQRREKLL